jgi:hypothetical protein
MADPPAYHEKKDIDKEKNDNTIVTSKEAGMRRVNASGHVDQLDRQYGLLSICATALTIGEFYHKLALYCAHVPHRA